jgi:hypothetical protein
LQVSLQGASPETFEYTLVFNFKLPSHVSFINGNGKVVPVLLAEHHAMREYWGSGGIVPLIL